MAASVNRREYNASGRRAASAERRGRILAAARSEFLENGYAATTMTEIAARADVALDTVYTLVGRKPALFRLLIETAISGADQVVPAEERGYVQAIRTEPTAEGKISTYASAITHIHERLAPLVAVLQAAAPTDSELDELWRKITDRRATNMRRFAQELAETGQLRVPVDEATDVIWATNSPELYLMLVRQRGWSPTRYESWLTDSWQRLLLTSSQEAAGSAK